MYLNKIGYINHIVSYDWVNNLNFRKHPTRIYTLNPNNTNEYYHTNSMGFRVNDTLLTIPKNKLIITVGDSFTFGHGVNTTDSYPSKLEQLLSQIADPISVYNAGVPGYGPDQEFIYIRDDLVPKYHPDIIIWEFYVNDISDLNQLCLFTKVGSKYIQLPAWLNSIYFQGWIAAYIAPNILKSHVVNLLLTAPNILYQKEVVTLGCTKKTQSIPEDLDKLYYFIQQTQKISQYTHTKFIYVIAPFQQYFQNSSSINKDYESLRLLFSSHNIPMLDLNQAIDTQYHNINIENNSTTQQNSTNSVLGTTTDTLSDFLFLKTDTAFPLGFRHLNENGNQLVAQKIYEYLINQNR